MRPLKIITFIFLFSYCSVIQTYEYEIQLENENKKNDGILVINKIENSFFNDSIQIDFQFFPKHQTQTESYILTFDMKFREDYETDFDGVCIGPTWNNDKPGELKIVLDEEYNFKSKIVGKFETNSQMDRCTTYFYYLRYFEANLESNQKILFGVATDYAEIYPDAPNYWIVNKNNEIEKIGTSNIDKYSLYFELSK